ncbi:hypothetical protein L484_013001 [Morus notabilis]|uniref:Uncharacterized protein n=1 Tax=Morus notabilis TaxID=981085 RepID=W9RVD3_9ROSA|nr:hypothetical protein L484_013001 [Morus notabilis]
MNKFLEPSFSDHPYANHGPNPRSQTISEDFPVSGSPILQIISQSCDLVRHIRGGAISGAIGSPFCRSAKIVMISDETRPHCHQ